MFVGAAFGAVALVASLASSFVLYKVADKVQSESDTGIAEATAEAAKANAIAAQANEKAEAERLARVKIEERIAPRRLSDEQKGKLREILSNTPGYTVVLCSRFLDAEGADFLSDFSETIAGSDWIVRTTNEWMRMQRGIFVAHVDFADIHGKKELENALTAAGLQPGFLNVNANDGAIPGGFQPGVLYLLIGGKP